MRAGVFVIAAALAGAPAGVAFAQQPGQAGQPGQQSQQGQQARPGVERQAAERPDAERQRAGMVASDAITGIDVRDHQGENIGDIDRLIINRQTGEVAHVIVSTGGFLGVGRDHIQLSWDQIELMRDDNALVARVNRAAVDGAPTIDRDRFDEAWERDRTAAPRTGVGTTGAGRTEPRTGADATGRDRDTATGTAGTQTRDTTQPQDTGQPRATAQQPAGADANLVAADRLRGSEVQDTQRQDIGRVERLMIDPRDGRVGYMVVGTGGFLGIGRDHLLVPFENAQVSMVDSDLVVMLDQRVIDEAPRAWTGDGPTGADRGTTDRR